jgi:hypothetical protein
MEETNGRKFYSDWIDTNSFYKEVRQDNGVPVYTKVDRPVIVCLCGSTRFYDAFQEANYRLTMEGKIVLSVGFAGRLQKQRVTIDGCMGPEECDVLTVRSGESVGCTPAQKVKLDELHKEKIDLADEVFVLNVGGYIGESTRSEIEHALKRHKPVRYLESPQS